MGYVFLGLFVAAWIFTGIVSLYVNRDNNDKYPNGKEEREREKQNK